MDDSTDGFQYCLVASDSCDVVVHKEFFRVDLEVSSRKIVSSRSDLEGGRVL